MSTPLPYWIQLLQALGTLAIATLAAVIAIAQWRIAKQKAVVDVFDKRMDVYNSLRAVVQKVMSAGNATQENCYEFAAHVDRAQFLFGDKVVKKLGEIADAMWLLREHETETAGLSVGEELTGLVQKRRKALNKVTSFYGECHQLLRPYMRMQQKAPWSPQL